MFSLISVGLALLILTAIPIVFNAENGVTEHLSVTSCVATGIENGTCVPSPNAYCVITGTSEGTVIIPNSRYRSYSEPKMGHWWQLLYGTGRVGIYAALLACMAGCGPAEPEEHSVTRVEFTVDTVATYLLEGRSLVDPNVLGSPDEIVASSDRLLVSDDKAENPLLVFDRFSGDLLKSAGAFGSGPGEVSGHLRLDVKTGKSEGWVLDIISQSLTYVHLDTLVATSFLSHRSTRIGNSGGVVLNSARMADGSILGWGVHPVNGLAKFDSSGAFEGAFGDAPPGADDVSMAVRNHAWRQTLRTSPDAERLVAAYYNADRLDIYDSGVLSHVVNGPEFFEPVYFADEEPGGQMLALQPDNRSGYVDVDVTEEFIYALYSGKKRDETNLGAERGAYFLVFDWTGRPVGRLNVPGSPSSMAVSADNSELYVIFKSPVPQIVRFEIPEILVQ